MSMSIHQQCQFCGTVFLPEDYPDEQCPCDMSQAYAHDSYDGIQYYEDWMLVRYDFELDYEDYENYDDYKNFQA